MSFPTERPRRLRQSSELRELVRETELNPARLIAPLFVCHGRNVRQPIESMPGHARLSIDLLIQEVAEYLDSGVRSIMLFGIPAHKDEVGSEAYDDQGIVQQAVRALKEAHPRLIVMTDVCLDEYTSHGHCGLVENGRIVNDPTLELLARIAVSHARAGADVVAPSDMMDGRVGAIRKALDEEGLQDTVILSYAVKYASAFYGPFREAAGSAPHFGDRRSYQMDPGNAREALREVRLDLEEGADMVMVKPAMPYLDILWRVRQAVDVPVAAYQVSGEYAMMEAAFQRGWLDRRQSVLESLLAIRRAGADLILTYWAKEISRWLQS